VALSAIAARTKTMTLGSAIAIAPLYDPVRFAEDAAIVDLISQGRLELALAVGYRRKEFDAFGVDYASRGRRTDDFLDIVRRLWAGETVSREGPHFTFRNASIMPLPAHRIPIHIGGFSKKAMERAATYGDGFHGMTEGFPALYEALQAHGKDPAEMRMLTQSLSLYVADDTEAALEELTPHGFYMNNMYGLWLNEDVIHYDVGGGGKGFMEPMTLEAFKASRFMQVVTPEKAISMLQRMQQRTPVDHYIMMVPSGMPLAKFAKYVQTFADKVMPAFA
jgi:alkanesulfonate monooxygenase SsuD/methylene tetrahydromethanopterin reductase-like flavin-dependent oxidoreductase (luciferase family)